MLSLSKGFGGLVLCKSCLRGFGGFWCAKSQQGFWWLCVVHLVFLINPAGCFGGFAVVLGQAINCTLRIKLKRPGMFVVDLFHQKPISP